MRYAIYQGLDITYPKLVSLHDALPRETDMTKSGEQEMFYRTRLNPSINLFDYMDKNRNASNEKLSQELKREREVRYPNRQKIELLEKMIEHPDSEGRNAIREEYLQNMKENLRKYLSLYRETLDTYPYRELADPKAMEERSKQMAEIKEQIKPVLDQLLKDSALREARVYMLKEDRNLLRPEDKPREIIGYVVPKTREEALQRIIDIDKKNWEMKPYIEAKQQISKGNEFFTGNINDYMANPQMVRQEIREFLKFMDGFQIDTSCLGDKRRTAYEGIRHDLETIAGQEPTSQLTTDDYINITSMANTIVNTHLYALGAKPEFSRFSGTPDMEGDYFNRDWERAQLIKDLAEFERKEEKSKSTMPRAEQGKTEASKRDRIDLKDLSREAAKAGETPSIRQRSRSMSSGQMQRQTRERSKSEPAPVKPELQKDGGPKR